MTQSTDTTTPPAKPVRVQLRRIKGWRMPANTVKVDRSTRYGNPFTVEWARHSGYAGTEAQLTATCLWEFRMAIETREPGFTKLVSSLDALRGKNLACWCSPEKACHADVLLWIVSKDAADPA